MDTNIEDLKNNLDDIVNLQPSKMYEFTLQLLHDWNISDQLAHFINSGIWLIALGIILFFVDWLTNKIIISSIVSLVRKTKTTLDDFFINNNTLTYIGRYIPLSLTKYLIPVVFVGFPRLTSALVTLIEILMIITLLMIIKSILKSIRDILQSKPAFADKPLGSYLQVVDILLFFLGGTIIFSIITGSSPWAFLGTLGAASAILMLVFKDTILGFVASVQVSANDSIRAGDWIEMPKHGADGEVIEINLNNIKVQNWDKTITTIPTHLLLTDAVKNWRGMQTSGGRRIKRAINIKISSIRFLNPEEIENLKTVELLTGYITERGQEIAKYNETHRATPTLPINERNFTNIGLFRKYVLQYVKNNPNINQNMTMLVRQMPPTETGLPIEIYVFSGDTRWAFYEDTMSDLFDHLFAAIKYFHLEVFESPASDDIRNLQLKWSNDDSNKERKNQSPT